MPSRILHINELKIYSSFDKADKPPFSHTHTHTLTYHSVQMSVKLILGRDYHWNLTASEHVEGGDFSQAVCTYRGQRSINKH